MIFSDLILDKLSAIAKFNRKLIVVFVCCCFLMVCCSERKAAELKTGSVIFIHPDGAGASMWGALRLLEKGPDGMTHWDKIERMGLYRGHLKNSTNSSSHGGATAHAFGVKVDYDTYGINPQKPIRSLSGKEYSIMVEVKKSGKSIALINSGHICEPGTGVFVSNALKRSMTDTISEQIISSDADIILAGGEELLLPKSVTGKHGKPGKRKDGKDLIEKARKLGYAIVYNRAELFALPLETEKVLGVFSTSHTFNGHAEETLTGNDLPFYNKDAPSVAEMTEVALKMLKHKGKDFFMVVEEEGSDNFSNANNARGALEALSRADAAIGVVMDYIDKNPNTLLVTAADSDAGGMQVVSIRNSKDFEAPLPTNDLNGAPLDGRNGTNTLPFVAKPDQFGNRLRFGITWACYNDVAGAVIAKAHGLNSELLPNNVDNTDLYRVMYATLFGIILR
ncbi:MAG: alkaline phosphatase [Deltaproteobacteria bacterium]|nr:alkaline phosphatase [Deltaproteobacteria bacterium]